MSLSKLRPRQGMVLVEMVPDPKRGMIEKPDQNEPSLTRAKVVRLGIWPQNGKGALIPYEVKVGDLVIVNRYQGTQLVGYPDRFKLVDHQQIAAVIQNNC